jgi:two-component system NtrC family sensor kinase
LQQVLVNVVVNAIHASPPGSSIILRASRQGDQVVTEVLDHGDGISDDNLARVFSPFFTTKPEGSGTGLGLSVSYGIVRKHGGTITLENREDKGVRVRISLPAHIQSSDTDAGDAVEVKYANK